MRPQSWMFFAGISLLLLGSSLSFGQTAADIWEDVPVSTVLAARRALTSERTVQPTLGRNLRVKTPALTAALRAAPPESSGKPATEFPLPMPDGTFARFAVLDSPVMDPTLAARYPGVRTFSARGIDDPGLVARFDLTPQGFHAIVQGGDGVSFYVDPYWRDDATHYVAYRRRDLPAGAKNLRCLVNGAPDPGEKVARAALAARPTGASLRTYRLAVACTGEYAAAAGGGTLLGTLGAIVTTVNRVSAVYERELSIRLRLVANQDQLIFLNATTDGFTNDNGDVLIDEVQSKIDAIIGNANYDIGHVFSTGGGGLATLAGVGVTGQKAQGVTGSSNPVGDPYDIDYVAHEMGHQFGANHPFNATSGSCSSTNRNATTAYEPGSGSTIMAYAGICSPQDLQGNSDDYFHTISYDEIDDHTSTSPGNVGVATATGNTPPTIASPGSFTIPINTPFALTASATDVDNDVLTYCWEQFDRGAAQNPTVSPRDNGASPIFRSFHPSRSPTRIFPSLNFIRDNANLPPATVGGFASGEFLPTTSRTMNFRVTVRDNRAGGGGSNYATATVTSTTTAGPFRVNSQGATATIAGGSTQTVTWSVANTTAAPVSCANVRISLSTDGGRTFPFVLAASTANDGTETVTIPNVAQVATTQGRIKVEAVGNIFFDLSNADLTITSTQTPPAVNVTSSVTLQRGSFTATTATVGTASSATGPLTVDVLDAPPDIAVSAVVSGGNLNVSAQAECAVSTTLSSRTYPVTLAVVDSVGSMTAASVNIVVQPNPAPTVGTYPNANVARNGSGSSTPTAAPADANGNLGPAPVAISPISLPGGGTLSINQTTGAITANATASTTLGNVPVTVTVQDACGAAVVRTFSFNVIAAAGPAIAAAGASAPTAENAVPANAAPDPAETVTVNLGLTNTGTGPTAALVATLQNSGNVIPITTSRSYGVIAAGATATQPFTFRINPAAACGSFATATLQIVDGATNLGAVTYSLRLGAAQGSSGTVQSFDSVNVPALPSGWTSTVPTGTNTTWRSSTTNPDTAPNSVSAIASTSSSLTQLESPPISIAGSAAQISFRHRWAFESDVDGDYDGGVLEISINNGAFQDVLAAGATFATGGYTGTIDQNFGNPLAGRSAWTGIADSAYRTTTVVLPATAAGQSVRLRWRLGSDEAVVENGNIWRLDTVTLSDTTFVCCGAPPAVTSLLPPGGIAAQAYSHTFTTSGTPPPTWSVTAGSLPPGLTLNPTGSLVGTPTAPGFYNGITVTADNGLNPAGAQTFGLLIANSFANYISTFGFSPADASPSADPDGDGVVNLSEYGQDLLANAVSTTGQPTATLKSFPVLNATYLTLTFTRLITATDLRYEVQVSADLVSWTTVATSAGGAVPSGPGLVGETGTGLRRTVEVRDTIPVQPGEGARRFIRLRISPHP